MVVLDLHPSGSLRCPLKYDPPLVVDANGIPSFSVAFEGLQPVAGRNRQIGEVSRTIHLNQLAKCNAFECLEALVPFFTEQLLGIRVVKGLDHACGQGDY